jgi:hypothetical protein
MTVQVFARLARAFAQGEAGARELGVQREACRPPFHDVAYRKLTAEEGGESGAHHARPFGTALM